MLRTLTHGGESNRIAPTPRNSPLARCQVPASSTLRKPGSSSSLVSHASAGCLLARRCRRGNDRHMNAGPQLRRGTGADANSAAEVYLRARHHAVPEIPPLAHPDDEVRQWMHGVLDDQEAWLAVADEVGVTFLELVSIA